MKERLENWLFGAFIIVGAVAIPAASLALLDNPWNGLVALVGFFGFLSVVVRWEQRIRRIATTR